MIYTNSSIQPPESVLPNLQCFWEAFPSGSGPADRTTYMFTYIDAQPTRPSLLTMMEEYWKQMPVYQVRTLASAITPHLLLRNPWWLLRLSQTHVCQMCFVGVCETVVGQGSDNSAMHCCLLLVSVKTEWVFVLVHLLCWGKVHEATLLLGSSAEAVQVFAPLGKRCGCGNMSGQG